MGVNEHKAQTRSERLIRAMDRLSDNLERIYPEPAGGTVIEGQTATRPVDGVGAAFSRALMMRG